MGVIREINVMSMLVKKIKKIAFYFAVMIMCFAINANQVNASENICLGYADIVEPLIPAVVNISIISKNTNLTMGQMLNFPEGAQLEEFNKLFERFNLLQEEDEGEKEDLTKPLPAGSGFIISSEGYIVTNYHVVNQADKIIVTLSNDQKFEATLVGFDNRTDIAVLKVVSKNPLPFVKFGNSDTHRVGDVVIAIGNPFGLGGTVTSGIISAQARDINASSLNIIDNFIQTDAAINRGNSGGPMFDTKGEVIGINFMIVSPTGDNIGIGFAVPSSVAKPVVDQLIKGGKVHHGWLGVAVQDTDSIAESLGLEEGVGALVSNVMEDSPAEKSNIQVGDIILKFDGKAITSSKKLPRIVATTAVGKKVDVEIMSKGKNKKISLVVGENDKIANKEVNLSDPKAIKSMYGMSLSELTSAMRKKLNLPSDITGIVVSAIEKKSLASRYGIKQGDIINSVNQNFINNPEELSAIVAEAKKNKRKSIVLLIYRAGGNVFLSLPVIDK
ncbi:MAG: Do family serine endopeptidase [Rickettsiales bacterium]